MTQPIDFSQRQNFPGVEGNQFDIILKAAAKIQSLPTPIFAILLFLWATLITWANWPATLAIFLFFFTDWILLGLLPRFKISYGPAKPPTLILALMRGIGLLLPQPLIFPAQLVGTALVLYGFYIEPHRVHLTQLKLYSNKIRAGQPIRILHLGDLHLERETRREIELQKMVTSLAPDLILFSGDVLNLSYLKDPDAWQAARHVLRQWQAPFGVYLVTGSPAVDLPEIMPDLLQGLPLTWLKDQRVSVDIRGDQLDLIGLTCTHLPHEDLPRLEKLAAQPSGNYTILLYHSPDLAPGAANLEIDMQLSGHTHGGQVRLPWIGAIFTGSLYGRKFQAGKYRLDNLLLYITRGIGMEGAGAPRVRFLCPPEIILWELSALKE